MVDGVTSGVYGLRGRWCYLGSVWTEGVDGVTSGVYGLRGSMVLPRECTDCGGSMVLPPECTDCGVRWCYLGSVRTRGSIVLPPECMG